MVAVVIVVVVVFVVVVVVVFVTGGWVLWLCLLVVRLRCSGCVWCCGSGCGCGWCLWLSLWRLL